MEVELVNGNLSDSENKKRLVSKKYYTIDKIKIDNKKMEDFCDESLIIYSILDGAGSIKSENHTLDIKKGESILIPVNVKVEVDGNLELLRTII